MIQVNVTTNKEFYNTERTTPVCRIRIELRPAAILSNATLPCMQTVMRSSASLMNESERIRAQSLSRGFIIMPRRKLRQTQPCSPTSFRERRNHILLLLLLLGCSEWSLFPAEWRRHILIPRRKCLRASSIRRLRRRPLILLNRRRPTARPSLRVRGNPKMQCNNSKVRSELDLSSHFDLRLGREV